MAGGGGGSNTTHALLSPDPETLPLGEVSRPATGQVPQTKGLQGQRTVAPHAPLTAGPNSSLSQRYGPAIITQELVAENGLFQPKLILTQKSPKLTPRLEPPEVGTRQLTLCPSSTNCLEPSSNLVPPEVPASGHHGFVKWGCDAKISKTGVIPRAARPARARPMAHREGGWTWDLHLSVQLEIRSGLPVGIEEWGRQLTTRRGEIGVPKWGHFGCRNEPKLGGAPNSVSPRRLGDRICHFIPDPPGVQLRLPCLWLSKIFMLLGLVTIPIGSTNAKMAKLSTLILG